MTDLRRETHLLITIAKVDGQLNAARTEAARLPDKITKADSDLKAIEKALAEADAHLEAMKKERRTLEQHLQDSGEKLKRLKVQLMEVKDNKEYQAMLHEISHFERAIDGDEERLLMLMDELDEQGGRTGEFKSKKNDEKKALVAEKARLESRLEELKQGLSKFEDEKRKILTELDPQIRKRYDRILAKLHDFAVTPVTDEACQGCHTRIPPQIVLEVKKNDQIITCQVCGRILVHYAT